MLPPKIRCLISLHYTSLNNSKNRYRYFSLIGFDHCNSKLCKNFQFEKDIHLYFSIFQKICRNIKVQRSYFGKIASFLSLEFISLSFLGIYRCRPYIATVVVDSIILQIEKFSPFSSKIFSISRNRENDRTKGQHINDFHPQPRVGPNGRVGKSS